MRSKTLALVSPPRTSTLSTGPMLEPPPATEAANQAAADPLEPPREPAVRALPAADPAAAPQWSSEQLLAGADEATITHGDQVYRLRRTLTGKLILTK